MGVAWATDAMNKTETAPKSRHGTEDFVAH
jgi:hypothetical protein